MFLIGDQRLFLCLFTLASRNSDAHVTPAVALLVKRTQTCLPNFTGTLP
jgi:hypothetical protein